jgi:NAD(P)-dependent dehydrogenase (short-subunit alcohol dehydrogenase family)
MWGVEMSSVASQFDLACKTALITGASSGLGVEFAKTLSGAGANVVLAARRRDRLEAVAAEITAAGGTALVVECDVTDEAQVAAAVAASVATYGGLDIAVANAGSVPEGGAMPEKMPADLFRQSIDINLTGTFVTAAGAARHMLANGGGSIILLASVGGAGGHFNIPVGYATAKAGTIFLAKYLANHWADRGVRVNAIGPGWFPSEMTDQVLALPAFKGRIEDQTPMGRVGEPEELLGTLLLLSSDAGSYITGQTIFVDGGMTSTVGASPYPDDLYALHSQIMPHGLGDRILPGA